jgi:hypothetical protein
MVKLNKKQANIVNGVTMPVMHIHGLRSTKHFNDNLIDCYITEMTNGRYAIFSSAGNTSTFYTVVNSIEQLHSEFDEV